MVWRLAKLVLWVVPVVVAAATVALWLWYKRDVHEKDRQVAKGLSAILAEPPEDYDFGLEKFDRAVAHLREGDADAARAGLLDLLRSHPSSVRAPEAMRLIGEMNIDQLLHPNHPRKGKRKVEIARGDSLEKAAKTNQCTTRYIVRANNLVRPESIQPNDLLWVCPLDFTLVVEISKNRLTLLDGSTFFASFPAAAIRPPPTLRLPAKSTTGTAWQVSGDRRTALALSPPSGIEKGIEIGRDWSIRSLTGDSPPDDGYGIFVTAADADDLITVLRPGSQIRILP